MAVTASLVINAGASARPSPRPVLFDATGSRSTAENDRNLAFRHLFYFMDYGDSTSGNWGDGAFGSVGAQSGLSRNDEYSPVGSHVYEVADGAGDQTFTAKVYVTDGATTDSATQSITVRDPNGALGYASTLVVSNTTDFTGAPAGATELPSTSDYDAAINTTAGSGSTHQRVLFRRSHTFTGSTPATFNVAGPVHVGAFGTGAAPLIETGFNGNLNNVSADNVSFADLEMDGNSGSASRGVNASAQLDNLLVLRCDVHHFTYTVIYAADVAATIHNGVFIHDSTCRNATGAGGNVVFGGAKNIGIMGCLIDDGTSAEHILRQTYMNVGVVGHSYLLNAAANKHTVKLHMSHVTSSDADGGVTHFFVFIQDRFKGGTNSEWVIGLGPQNEVNNEHVEDGILDSCWFEGEATTQRWLKIWAGRITVRNCLFHLTPHLSLPRTVAIDIEVRGGETNAHDDCEFYNNTFYSAEADLFEPIKINTGSGHIVTNNLGYGPNSTGQDFVSGAGAWTESNNTSAANILVDPKFARSNGDGTGTLTDPDHFKIRSGQSSHAEGTGIATTNLMSFFVPTTRINVTPDMGFHQLAAGDVFPVITNTVRGSLQGLG